jgi:hypothetical protein
MKYLYLNKDYNNDYLTTHRGMVFTKDRSKQRPIQYNEESLDKDPELKFLIKQGTIVAEETKEKMDVIKDTPSKTKTVKEQKTQTSEKDNEEALEQVESKEDKE